MTELARLRAPVFAAEGIQRIPLETFRLEVRGCVNRPLGFSLSQLKKEFRSSTASSRLTSVSGWSVRVDWDGILWRDFLPQIKVASHATHALFHSAEVYTTCVSFDDLDRSTSMLVWGVCGEPLEEEYGAPLRMVVPNLWGYKSCKWLKTIEILDHYKPGYWETRGYTDSGTIEPGKTVDINTKTTRTIAGGEVTDF